MNNEKIVAEVERFYFETVYPKCPKYEMCKKDWPNFSVKPKMSYIGREFGNNTSIPNLVFLSLDSGDEYNNYHTITEIRDGVEDVKQRPQNCVGIEKTRHWYQTFDLAKIILDPFLPDSLKIGNAYVNPYIVHTNSAKCTQNKPNRNKADDFIFHNCREFVIKELELYNPDIIITQGRLAEVVLNHFSENCRYNIETIHNSKNVKMSIFERNLTGKRIIHIPTYHPTYFKGYWSQKTNISNNVEIISQIVLSIKV
jgi:uracil-DNA glycosylase family 4